MAKKVKEEEKDFNYYFPKVSLYILKSPYYFVKWIFNLNKELIEKNSIAKIRRSIDAKYLDFKVLETLEGNYDQWLKNIYNSDSQIGLVLGARGSGKTAFGMKFLENTYAQHKKKCFAMGFQEKDLPSWINSINDISQLPNDSYVLVDESGILFSSRSSMTTANKLLSELIILARHKDLTILFITQNSSNIEVNILRQADFLVLKPSSLLQREFERKIIEKMYEKMNSKFVKYKNEKGVSYIFSGKFRGFVSNSLPSFWKESISKSFKNQK